MPNSGKTLRMGLIGLLEVTLLICVIVGVSYLSIDPVYASQPFPTVRPQPATFDAPFTAAPPLTTPFSTMGPIDRNLTTANLPTPLAWAAGTLAAMTSMLAGVTFFGKREATQPRIFPLILTAILLTVATLLVELLFVAAEVILVTSGLGETPPGVLLGIVLAGLGLFLIDFDLAFVIYVYRVANAAPGEEVQLNLWPWEGWGLSPGK